jgi:D-2-hydroxyacid dehydrogenase (NADP+)
VSTNVLVLETYADVYAAALRERFLAVQVRTARSLADLPEDVSGIDVLVAFGIAIDDGLMRGLTRLKWIQSLATGVDHFLRSPHLRPETLLTSARGIHGPAMRETVAFLMLSVSRDAPRLMHSQAAREWERRPWTLLAGKAAVIVGVGLSSTAVAQLLKAFGMRVVGVSRSPRAVEGFDEVVGTERLAAAASDADYLINILPGDPENHDRINAEVFGAMRETAYFINVGRGETVDEAALIEALRSKRIAGAGLDVFRHEPLPADNPLWTMANVVATPHVAGLFTEYEAYVLPILLENMGHFLDGRHGQMRNLIKH